MRQWATGGSGRRVAAGPPLGCGRVGRQATAPNGAKLLLRCWLARRAAMQRGNTLLLNCSAVVSHSGKTRAARAMSCTCNLKMAVPMNLFFW